MSYSTSKHALNGLTKVLAVDYASKGVRVNALCPGLTDTDILSVMTDDLREGLCRHSLDAYSGSGIRTEKSNPENQRAYG